MKPWQRRTLGILTVGGSFTVLVTALAGTFSQNGDSFTDAKLILVISTWVAFVAISAWGVWCGVMMFEGRQEYNRMNLFFWALQIPSIHTPYFGYLFTAGVSGILSVLLRKGAVTLSLNWHFGAQYEFNWTDDGEPVSVGVNLIAQAVVLFLARHLSVGGSPTATPPRIATESEISVNIE